MSNERIIYTPEGNYTIDLDEESRYRESKRQCDAADKEDTETYEERIEREECEEKVEDATWEF